MDTIFHLFTGFICGTVHGRNASYYFSWFYRITTDSKWFIHFIPNLWFQQWYHSYYHIYWIIHEMALCGENNINFIKIFIKINVFRQNCIKRRFHLMKKKLKIEWFSFLPCMNVLCTIRMFINFVWCKFYWVA